MNTQDDLTIDIGADHVAVVEIRRPPNNFFDLPLVRNLADALEELDAGGEARAVLLCSEGRHFCAGADFSAASSVEPVTSEGASALYREGVRLWKAGLPIVAAVQGAAIGGGLGLACAADFRVASPEARFAANFARLGIHQGFGLTVTLPEIVGRQAATDLLLTGRRIGGEEAARIGLADRLVDAGGLRQAARDLAAEIAGSAPLAVRSIRSTLRGDLAERVRAATLREEAEQTRLRTTHDFAEGIAASAERRPPRFTGS